MTKQAPDEPTRIWLAFPERHPYATLAATLVVVVLSILLIRTIQTDGSLEAMLPQGNSSSAALAQIAEDFDLAQEATLLVALPEDGVVAPRHLVDFADRFSEAIRAGQGADAPACDVVYNWPGDGKAWTREVVAPNLVLFLDDDGQAAFRERLTPAGMAQQFRMNERAAAAPGVAGSALAPLLEDPLRLREFVGSVYDGLADAGGGRPGEPMFSADGRSLLIRVTSRHPTHDAAEARGVMQAVRSAIDAAKPGDLRVSVGGGLAIAETAERTIRADMILSSTGTVVLLQVLFLLTYRRLLLFPVVFLPAAVGVLASYGVFAMTGRALSPPTAVLGALLAGLGIDYAVHYIAHAGRGDPLYATSRRLAVPLGMACVTSVIAFLTLVLSDVSALRDFATIGAVGLAATWVTTLTVLPALLKLMDARAPGRGSHGKRSSTAPRWHFDRAIHEAVKHQKSGLALTLGATVAAAVLLIAHPHGPVRFDADLGNMHPQPNRALEAQRDIAEAFPGRGEALMIHITAPTERQLIQRAESCTQRLAEAGPARDVVATTYGLDRLIPAQDTQAKRRAFSAGFDPDSVLADFDHALDSSIFKPDAFKDYRDSLTALLQPDTGLTLSTLTDYPSLSAGMLPPTARHRDDTDANYQAVSWVFLDTTMRTREDRAAAIDAIRGALAEIPGVTLTGMTVVGHDVELAVRSDLPVLLGVAACVVACWLLLCFRNLRDTAMALLPVTAGLLLTFAAMRIGGVGLNLLNLVALPLLAGLGIDDGVFLVTVARSARKRGEASAKLLRQLAASAQAVTLTSATTALAFGSLVLTGVPAIRSLGIVMAIGILACWAVTVLALAPLLIQAHPSRHDAAAKFEGNP